MVITNYAREYHENWENLTTPPGFPPRVLPQGMAPLPNSYIKYVKCKNLNPLCGTDPRKKVSVSV